MANKKVVETDLEYLQQRASKLASTVESLAVLFEQEKTRLRRRDEIVRLKTLGSNIIKRVEKIRDEERSARYGYNRGKMVGSLIQLGAGLLTMASENKTMRAISHGLLTGIGGDDPPYGKVVISIGPKGLTEDVEVVSISQLARESKQDESEVTNRLQESGNLLFSEETFSHLIDRLVGEILEGRLGLPVSKEKVSQLQQSNILRLHPENKD